MGICVSSRYGDEPILRAQRHAVSAIRLVSSERTESNVAGGEPEAKRLRVVRYAGNAFNWCDDLYQDNTHIQRLRTLPRIWGVRNQSSTLLTPFDAWRSVWRSTQEHVRSASRFGLQPLNRCHLNLSFRPARTCP